MSNDIYHPEARPCPECGGARVIHEDIGPEVVAYSSGAAQAWEKTKKGHKFDVCRCTNCGYTAFFFKEHPPKPSKK